MFTLKVQITCDLMLCYHFSFLCGQSAIEGIKSISIIIQIWWLRSGRLEVFDPLNKGFFSSFISIGLSWVHILYFDTLKQLSKQDQGAKKNPLKQSLKYRNKTANGLYNSLNSTNLFIANIMSWCYVPRRHFR